MGRCHAKLGRSVEAAAALEAGALGCSISGSGPSVFAFASSDEQATDLAGRIATTFQTVAGLDSDTYAGQVNTSGARRVGAV